MDAAITYAKENLAVVEVLLRDPYHEQIVRDRRMSRLSFLGAMGGWFGLCCGLSVISVIEMLYHAILLLIALYKKEPVRKIPLHIYHQHIYQLEVKMQGTISAHLVHLLIQISLLKQSNINILVNNPLFQKVFPNWEEKEKEEK